MTGGEPLPPKYRLMLSSDAPEVELIWQGKTSEVTNVVLPFQSIEQVDEPRGEIGQDANPDAFAPPTGEIEKARRIVLAFEEAERENLGEGSPCG